MWIQDETKKRLTLWKDPDSSATSHESRPRNARSFENSVMHFFSRPTCHFQRQTRSCCRPVAELWCWAVARLYRSPLFSGCVSFCTTANALDRVSSISGLHDTLDVVYRARVCGRNPARVFSCAKDSGSRIERRALYYQALRSMFALAAAASHRPFSLLEATFNLALKNDREVIYLRTSLYAVSWKFQKKSCRQ